LKSIMVTGDYKDTAEAIARDIGLVTPGGLVITGAELDRWSDEQLAAQADRLDVCCRVSPQHKTRIVEALKARGHVVAMTGDGVNDAPALKRANIGVAMGITGTDVAKQTADMVLTDDNFASIVAAIEQGRIIYSNIRKFVYFLLACNVGEILIVFGAMLVGMPLPLRPVQLLWLNLVSDGAPALALGMEKGDDDIMEQPPRSPREHVINRDMAVGIAVVGLVDAIAVLGVFFLALQRYPGQLQAAQTIAFVTLCCSELLRAFTARSEYHSIFSIGVFSNRWMAWAVAASFLLVLLVVYVPVLQPFFDTVPPSLDDWLFMLPFFFVSPLAMELLKLHFRRRAGASSAFVPVSEGGSTMQKVLVPVGGTRGCDAVMQYVIREFMNNTAMEVHLLNVQPRFRMDVARFVKQAHPRKLLPGGGREGVAALPREAGPLRRALRDALAGGRRRALHHRIGAPPALRPHPAGTARMNSLTRLLEDSVTNKVLQLTSLPVEVIAGDTVSRWERYGIRRRWGRCWCCSSPQSTSFPGRGLR
jgi:Ca2+-transporting ATPase